jgi:hypothetical protein
LPGTIPLEKYPPGKLLLVPRLPCKLKLKDGSPMYFVACCCASLIRMAAESDIRNDDRLPTRTTSSFNPILLSGVCEYPFAGRKRKAANAVMRMLLYLFSILVILGKQCNPGAV